MTTVKGFEDVIKVQTRLYNKEDNPKMGGFQAWLDQGPAPLP